VLDFPPGQPVADGASAGREPADPQK
jgi:hypothetical protein